MNLSCKNIYFSYKDRPILKGVSFEAKAGEVTAVIGANAVGKSTLLRILSGILKAQGQVRLGEELLANLAPREAASRIGYLTQEGESDILLSVFEVVLLGRMTAGGLKVPPEALERVWEVLRDMNIEHLAQRQFGQLSGGQRRMALIAQTVVRDPKILLLDEPTANLDMHNQMEVLEQLRHYTQANGTATLLTLHDINMAARYADKIVMLRDGVAFPEGSRGAPPAEILTTDAIRQVYRIEAEVGIDSQGYVAVHPLHPVPLNSK